MKKKSLWCYIDGKKHCDVFEVALAGNMDREEAKRWLVNLYLYHRVTFKGGVDNELRNLQ